MRYSLLESPLEQLTAKPAASFATTSLHDTLLLLLLKQTADTRRWGQQNSCMCGRARCSLSREEVAAYAKLDQANKQWDEKSASGEEWEPKYNLGPGNALPIVVKTTEGALQPRLVRWGLIPSWTKLEQGQKPDFFRMFNARSESVPDKPVFSRLLSAHRCVVLLNGFYEWKQEGVQGKQPYYVHLEGEPAVAMAGLADSCRDPEDPERRLASCTILTTDACKRLEWLHNRMPVLLRSQEAQDTWLSDGPLTTGQLEQLFRPYNGEDLAWHPVTPAMGKISFQGPECCKPLKRQTISTFFKPLQGQQQQPAAPGATPAATAQEEPVKSAAEAAAGPSLKAGKAERAGAGAGEGAGVAAAERRGGATDMDVARAEEEHQDTGAEGRPPAAPEVKREEGEGPGWSGAGKGVSSSPGASGKKRQSPAGPKPSPAKKAKPGSPPGQGTIDSFFIKNSK